MGGVFDVGILDGRIHFMAMEGDKRKMQDLRDSLIQQPISERFNVPNWGWKNVTLLDCANRFIADWKRIERIYID
jgi:hypothetical protein